MPTTPNYEKARKLANSLLKESEINSPPVSTRIIDIATSKGLRVQFVEMPKEVSEEVSGVFDQKSQTIYVNSEDPPKRQAFTIAHELGHFVLEHKPNEYGFLPRFANVVNSSPVEKEANYFAANLLIPKEMLDEAKKKFSIKGDDIDLYTGTLADYFGVSEEFMKYRIDGLKWQE